MIVATTRETAVEKSERTADERPTSCFGRIGWKLIPNLWLREEEDKMESIYVLVVYVAGPGSRK
jgi:hypothetical protein